MTQVQDLKCGDVFKFRDTEYVTLLSFTDERHVQSIITAITRKQYNEWPVEEVQALQLIRTFEVEIVTKYGHIKLTVHNTTEDEAVNLPYPKIKEKS